MFYNNITLDWSVQYSLVRNKRSLASLICHPSIQINAGFAATVLTFVYESQSETTSHFKFQRVTCPHMHGHVSIKSSTPFSFINSAFPPNFQESQLKSLISCLLCGTVGGEDFFYLIGDPPSNPSSPSPPLSSSHRLPYSFIIAVFASF